MAKKKLKNIEGSGGGGKSGGGGGVSNSADTLITDEVVKTLHLLGEGVINLYTGDGRSIFLNNIPMQNADLSPNFGGTSFEFRSGLASQAPLTTTQFNGASAVYTVNAQAFGGTTTPLVAATPVIYDVLSGLTDYCKVGISFPHGLLNTTSNGSIVGDSVNFAIDTKPHASSTWTQIINTTINDKSSAPAVVQYKVNNPSGIGSGVLWDIRLRRITQDNESAIRKNAIFLGTVEEVQQIQLSYDGVSYLGLNINAANIGGMTASIPSVSFMMSGATVNVPSNYNVTTRAYTGTWDGTFTTGVTDNPAWILYDILTNTNYGCGIYGITPALIDKYSFYNAGVFNDALVGNGAGSTEPRFTFNAALQNRQDMLKTLQDIAGMQNAVLGMVNGLITIFQDRPTNSMYAINKSNVIGAKGSPYFSYNSSAAPTRTTVCNVTWSNAADLRYLPKISSVKDSAGLARYGYQAYDLAAYGATTEGQAIRAGKWWLYANLNQQETVSFKMGLQGLLVNLFDVFDLYDEDYTLQAGAGRVVSATSNTVTFDQPVVVSGTSPTVSIWQEDGTYETHPITTVAGTWSTVTISGTFAVTPAKYASYIINSAIAPRTFRIIDLKIDGKTKECTVTAQLYDKNNYTTIETGVVVPADTYTTPVTNVVENVTNITFTPNSYISPIDGGMQRGVTIGWDIPTTQVTGYIVKWRWNKGSYVTTPKITTNAYEMQNILPGEYDVVVYALNVVNSTSSGTLGTYNLSIAGGVASLAEVTGLSVTGGGTIWTNPDCSISFTNPSTNGGELAGFNLTITNGATTLLTKGLPPVIAGASDSYIFTYGQNQTSTGGPYRSITVNVQGIDIDHNTTTGVSATFTNPAPVAPANLTITRGFNANQINYNKPADPDYVGTLVWQSNISGFTPDAATIVYTGPDTAYADVVLSANTIYYYRVASYDTFYNPVTDTYLGTGLNISPEVSPTMVPLVAPTGFTIDTLIGGSVLKWDASTDITDLYEVLWNTTNTFSSATIYGTVSANHITISGIPVNVNYWFWVRKLNVFGVSGPATTVLQLVQQPLTDIVGGATVNENFIMGTNALGADTTGSGNVAVGYDALAANTTGSNNIAIGSSSLSVQTTNNYNIAFGYSALHSATADYNIAIGYQALTSNTTGTQNLAIGYDSLYLNSVGNLNLAIGFETLSQNTSGSNNTAIGLQAMLNNTTGIDNLAIGPQALQDNISSNYNIAIGNSSLLNNTASYNLAIGNAASYQNTTGTNNLAIGYDALYNNLTGSNNIAVGPGALQYNTVSYNTGIGYAALNQNTTGTNNFGIGDHVLQNNSTGSNNLGLGLSALGTNATGSYNIAIGYQSMLNNIASSNIAVGNSAMANNTTGTYNLAIGQNALFTNLIGNGNVAIGYQACVYTTGNYNIGIGESALSNNSTGTDNIGIGLQTLVTNTTGIQNIAIGDVALQLNVSGNYNVGLGVNALSHTTGSNNIGIGSSALASNTTGTDNTGIGLSAGSAATGNQSCFFGSNAGTSATTGTNKIIIGFNAQSSTATVSNEITLGNSSITSLRCAVTSITALSDERDKKDILELSYGLDFVKKLKPVEFTWNTRDGVKIGIKSSGFIAQDLQKSQDEFNGAAEVLNLVNSENPERLEATYGHLIPVLVKAIQDLNDKFEAYKASHP